MPDIVAGPLETLEGLNLSLWLASISEAEIEEMREMWHKYSKRPNLIDAELLEEEE